MPPKLHQLQNVIAHEGPTTKMCLGKRTGQIFATCGEDSYLNLWSIGSRNPRITFGPFPSPITACKFSINEEQIAVGLQNGSVLLYDLNTSECITNGAIHKASVTSFAFNPQNPDILLSTSADGKLSILNIHQRKPLQVYSAHAGTANWVSCSPDGKLAATCGDDRNVKVYDIVAAKKVASFECHSDCVSCCEFHPSEPILASCGADRSVRFYDLQANKEIPAEISLDSAPVDQICFSSEAPVVFSVSSDYLKVVGWKPPKLLDHFAIGLERVHDICLMDSCITIASSAGDHALIHRAKIDGFFPFSTSPSPVVSIGSVKSSTPRFLDISAMPSTPKSSNSEDQKRTSPPSAIRRASSIDSSEGKVFLDFRKNRAQFMTKMNEKYTKLTKIGDQLTSVGLTQTLEGAAKTGELGSDILLMLRMKPESVTLENAFLVLQICEKIFQREKDLAVSSIESVMQAFGRLASSTMDEKDSRADPSLEERKKNCGKLIVAFRSLAPYLRTVSTGNSNLSGVASEILQEFSLLAR